MFGVHDYSAFVIAVIVFLAIPGPGNLALVTSTGQGGVRAGLAATLGLIAGDQVLLWLAVVGLAAVLQASTTLFAAVQWLGAAYLAWLGLLMLRAKPGAAPVIHIRPHHYVRQALLITVLNPKAIVFYMAFFPVFVKAGSHPGWHTFAAMALTIAVLTLAYGAMVVLLTRYLARAFRRDPRWGVWLQRVAGVALLGFGVKLVLSR